MNEKHHQIPMLTNCEVSFGLPFLCIPTAGSFSLCEKKRMYSRKAAKGFFFAPLRLCAPNKK
jgi:hypothetical protein